MTPEILFEDNHCLVLNKPAGMLSQGDETGRPSLVSWTAEYLKVKYRKPGNVYVGLVHRLDQPTSGVVLLARTSKAAGRLSDQFRTGAVSKLYWAIVEGRPDLPEGEWVDHLEKDRTTNRVRVTEEGEGKFARVAYEVLTEGAGMTKLALRPSTGRSHQLRVQLAERNLPIVGDRKYGSRKILRALDGEPRIALHARELSFTHPTLGETVRIEAPVQADWPESSPAWWGSSRGR
ncbi:RluA family pseudouridine synthase [Planctomyces sp. SH-PL62]|uniref:RluA family pseudouridine synthase n=1 Tax=Planctomyces sp. SH-PL62 TaxID=1636152 RepID=UPI00078D9A30|nr:RluA family pseudouridine synthase [Planctomyces sp. SH-PL62]AMV36969.1 Ribosomal large subunit pseudouridine synthase C [Planctomyces sp. SH-PL62]